MFMLVMPYLALSCLMSIFVSDTGRVIHLWRFSEARGRLFIARSLLCTDDQVNNLT